MKHVDYFLYQNTYTVILIERISFRNSQEQFLFLSQFYYFSPMQDVVSVSQRLVLLEGISFCPLLRQADWGFLPILPFPSRQALLGKKGIKSWCKDIVYIQLIIL